MIRDSFWTDAYIEKLTPDEKLIFLYLLTNPLCNVAGIYEVRSKRIGFETGYDIEVVENILSRFERDKKILRHNDYIVLVNSLKNQSMNPSIIQGCNRIIMALPSDMQEKLTGWVQAGLLNLTLLNLTLPNPTKPQVEDIELVVDDTKKESSLIPEVIKLFETVDPKNKTYYGNKSQRAACEFLIEEYSFEETKKRIAILPMSNKTPYFPTITTPCQLRDKWVQLEDAIQRKQIDLNSKDVVAF
jgi:hypothetical protein